MNNLRSTRRGSYGTSAPDFSGWTPPRRFSEPVRRSESPDPPRRAMPQDPRRRPVRRQSQGGGSGCLFLFLLALMLVATGGFGYFPILAEQAWGFVPNRQPFAPEPIRPVVSHRQHEQGIWLQSVVAPHYDEVINNVNAPIAPFFPSTVMAHEAGMRELAQAYNLNPNLVAILMTIESCGWQDVVSIADGGDPQRGAQSYFQVMPMHFSVGEDMFEFYTNGARGMNYYTEGLIKFNGNVEHAFAGYNGGHNGASRTYNLWSRETQRYYYWAEGIWRDVNDSFYESPSLKEWYLAGGQSLCDGRVRRTNLDQNIKR